MVGFKTGINFSGGAKARSLAIPVCTAPLEGDHIFQGETVTVSATTTDTDLDSVRWIIDGVTQVASDASSPYSTTWALSLILAVGAHTIQAESVKGALTKRSPVVNFVVAAHTLESLVFFRNTTPTPTYPSVRMAPNFTRGQHLVRCTGQGGGGTQAVGGGGGGSYAEKTTAVQGAFSIPPLGTANTDGASCTYATNVCVAPGGKSGANGGAGGTGGTGDLVRNGGAGTAGAGSVSGGGGAGQLAAGVAGAGGSPDGGIGQNATAGREAGAGGGSSAGAGTAGAGGVGGTDYYLEAVAGYARKISQKPGRDGTGTSHPVTMPDATVLDANGDLFLLKVASDSVPGAITVAGWTKLRQDDQGDGSVASFYKVAAGGDTATIASANSVALNWNVERWKGAGTPEVNGTTGSSTNANPPAITYSGGSAKLRVEVFAAINTSSTSVTGFPTGYTRQHYGTPAINGSCFLVSAGTEIETASAIDPPAFANGNTTWAVQTIVIPGV